MKNKPFLGKHGPLLIAEIGGNHEGNFEYAVQLTDLAISTGADVVKFQLYHGDTLVSRIENPQRNEHFKKFELTPDQHIFIAKKVINAGKRYLASVWEREIMHWINPFLEMYKIGSGDLTAYPIIKQIAGYGKPIILSTGLATEKEVLETIKFIQDIDPKYKDPDYLAILQCTSMYPVSNDDAGLGVIKRFKEITGLTIGYSDHTEGLKALCYATVMGAEILEFHFTDSRTGKIFRDHKVSLTHDEVEQLIYEINEIYKLQGDGIKRPMPVEIENKHHILFRRAVYPSRNINSGETIKENDLICLRPNHGIDARDFDRLVGKVSKINLLAHQKLDWDYFE